MIFLFLKYTKFIKEVDVMKNIAIIGAGNIGSRHLQALKKVIIPLDISVIDPSDDSLKIAKERYDSIPEGYCKHEIKYLKNYEGIKDEFDIAIIATHSTIRRTVIEQLLKLSNVKFFILEKILFNKAEDYFFVRDLLKEHDCQAWVNCTRRVIPFYMNNVKNWFNNKKIIFTISGSQWKLISNLIHFVDYLAYILDDDIISIDFNNLDMELINSNIPNFLELNGIIKLSFTKGSLGFISCFSTGTQPLIIDIASNELRCIINEGEGKTLVNFNNKIGWEEFESKILYTSQLTSFLVEDILKNNKCSLTPYNESMKLHLSIYNPLLKLINENFDKEFTYYPFT